MPRGSPARIPTLDGIRAIAIALVFVCHVLGTQHVPHGPRDIRYLLGDIGVRTFFILSGFLITTLLAREYAKTRAISLRGFFVRRAFRIFPAFFTYLGVMAVLAGIGAIVLPAREIAWAASYTMNFHTPETWWVGHLWSLAVEEQFYLIWPLTVVIVGLTRSTRVALGAIIAAPLLRAVAHVMLPELEDAGDHAFPFVFDALAIGCVLALVRDQLERSPRYLAILHARVFWLLPIAALTAFTLSLGHPVPNAFAISFANVGIVMALHRCVLTPTGAVGRFLELRPLVWVGTLSYSLYLWQQPFLNRHTAEWFTAFPVNLVLSVALGCASYYLIERPVLRWRARSAEQAKQRAEDAADVVHPVGLAEGDPRDPSLQLLRGRVK
ncbi:MAG: acyltransferase [Deltaproteobacteria bacterium]|nr:acyltransferase [Deltaproteobacteria bacterium]